MFIVLLGLLLAGCKDDNSKAVIEDAISGDTVPKEEVPNSPSTSSSSELMPNPIEPDLLGNLIDIKISIPGGAPSVVPANSKLKLRITGFYDNGTVDLTDAVDLRILDDTSNITLTEDNQIQAGIYNAAGAYYNETWIEAEFGDIKTQLKVKVIEGVCEAMLTRAQVEALGGACVMSYTYDGKEYLYTPGKKFMDELGYTASNIEENEGRTYARIHEVNSYALFRRDGKGMTWANFTQDKNPYGQAERFCNDLAEMEFNKKANWQMATSEDLTELINHHKNNGLIDSDEGLPFYFSIWSDERFVNNWGAYVYLIDKKAGKIGVKSGTVLSSVTAVICRSS